MTKPIINVADAPMYRGKHGEQFEFAMAALARTVGARAIGANVTRVPPGKAAFPLHHYHTNSTQLLPEVAGYPESGKTGIRLGMGEAADVRYLLRDADKDAIGYWDGADGRGA